MIVPKAAVRTVDGKTVVFVMRTTIASSGAQSASGRERRISGSALGRAARASASSWTARQRLKDGDKVKVQDGVPQRSTIGATMSMSGDRSRSAQGVSPGR